MNATYIRRCLQLAQKGTGTTSPNPLVGAVIVKEDRIIGEGFHLRKGEAHAEVVAIENATESVEGSILYCSLEPCCHTNKTTPPCTDLILKSGIKKVVVATLDPNPEVAGKGLALLKSKGLEVSHGYCEAEAHELNKVFFKSVKSNLPYIHVKVAITLDGRIATSSGDSKWISSVQSRSKVHELRQKYDAVMVGRATLNADNPKLTARKGDIVVKDPMKIVVGNPDNFAKDLNLLKNTEKLLVLNTGRDEATKENWYKLKNGKFIEAFQWIKSKGVESILLEGGSKLISEVVEQELYDEITIFICPKVIGNGPSFFNSTYSTEMSEALHLKGVAEFLENGEVIYKVRKNVYRSS